MLILRIRFHFRAVSHVLPTKCATNSGSVVGIRLDLIRLAMDYSTSGFDKTNMP